MTVRAKGAGHYDFSHDATVRAEQMASLKAQRSETERVQQTGNGVQEARRRKLDERRAMLQAKRERVMSEAQVEEIRSAKREAEAERILNGLDRV